MGIYNEHTLLSPIAMAPDQSGEGDDIRDQPTASKLPSGMLSCVGIVVFVPATLFAAAEQVIKGTSTLTGTHILNGLGVIALVSSQCCRSLL